MLVLFHTNRTHKKQKRKSTTKQQEFQYTTSQVKQINLKFNAADSCMWFNVFKSLNLPVLN